MASIPSAPRANGDALREVFGRQAADGVDDEAFGAAVARARRAARGELDQDPWRDCTCDASACYH